MDITKQSGPTRIDTMICAQCRDERRKRFDVEIGQFRFTLCEDCLRAAQRQAEVALEGE